ncbi:MAG TPA: glycoside hydrolase family 30 protein [Polyangia bacterium]
MTRLRAWFTTVSLAGALAGCGPSSPGTTTGSAGTGAGQAGAGDAGAGGSVGPGSGGTTGAGGSGTGAGGSSVGAGGSSVGAGGSSVGSGGSSVGSGGSSVGAGGSSVGSGGSSVGSGGSSVGSGGSVGTAGSAGTAGRGGTTGSGGSASGSGGGGGSSTAGTGGTTPASPLLVTSAQGAYWKTGTLTTSTANPDMTVMDGTTYQTWDGFGGAFNEMGWDDLMQLSQADRDRAMKLLFDGTDGAHFVFGRIPIGASDYAMDRYTLDETAGDYNMASFSIARDQMRLIPYVKAALAINPDLRLWASPWTPPTWMKTTSGTANGASCALTGNTNFDGGCMQDNAQMLQALALYLVKFVQAYAGQQIKIEAIHHQNEPGYGTGYPSCLWSSALYTKFIGTYLGPTFASNSVTAKIYLGTMSNNDSGKDGSIITAVNADTTASKYIAGFGLQWNMLPVVSSLTSKGLPILQTEHKCGNYPWGGETTPFNTSMAPNDYNYAIESWGLIRDWIKANVTSYSTWNMVLDNVGIGIGGQARIWPQNALLTVDRTAKTLNVTATYYVFRHFSQYVVPGAKRVAIGGNAYDALAFKNPDGSLVAILNNATASAKSAVLSIGGAKYQLSVPANGFATVRK